MQKVVAVSAHRESISGLTGHQVCAGGKEKERYYKVITKDTQMRYVLPLSDHQSEESNLFHYQVPVDSGRGQEATLSQDAARCVQTPKIISFSLHLYSQTVSCHQQLVKILWWLPRPKEEPNSAKPRAKEGGGEEEEKKEKRTPTVDISIRRNEILNIFIIPSICSDFSLHTAIFPFSLLSYWHGAQGLERNLSFII